MDALQRVASLLPAALVDLIRSCFRLGCFEAQVNTVDGYTLRDGQRFPKRHADLLVRVAGCSDYLTLLDRKMQDEIIRRTGRGGLVDLAAGTGASGIEMACGPCDGPMLDRWASVS